VVAVASTRKRAKVRGLRLALVFATGLALPALAADREIASFSGLGTGATRPFTVAAPWEVQFSTEGDLVVKLMSANGQLLGVVAGQIGGSGSYYSPTPGTFYLSIIALSPWHIRIVEIESAR
jgi:hypothetical protein